MKVFDVKQDFAFDKISLANPQPVQGGTYFTKLRMDDEPLYLQLPKCLTKQGVVTTKKGKYCDLMYESIDEEVVINFIENLESRCQELINNKKHLWFHTELTKDDISSMMTPICRMYKSGKNILIRVTIETCKQTNKDKCIAYTEEEVLVDLVTLQDHQKTIPLICIDGIKFSSRSFEIVINLKQLMLLNKQQTIEQTQTCLIKRNVSSSPKLITSDDTTSPVPASPVSASPVPASPVPASPVPASPVPASPVPASPVPARECAVATHNPLSNPPPSKLIEQNSVVEKIENTISNTNYTGVTENNQLSITESLPNNSERKDSEPQLLIDNISTDVERGEKNNIEEIELDMTDNKETINLKQPSEVYYEIYKAAKKKAKHMRQVALDAYMDAQQIKAKFSLDDLEETDDSDYESGNSEDESNDDTPHLNLAEN